VSRLITVTFRDIILPDALETLYDDITRFMIPVSGGLKQRNSRAQVYIRITSAKSGFRDRGLASPWIVEIGLLWNPSSGFAAFLRDWGVFPRDGAADVTGVTRVQVSLEVVLEELLGHDFGETCGLACDEGMQGNAEKCSELQKLIELVQPVFPSDTHGLAGLAGWLGSLSPREALRRFMLARRRYAKRAGIDIEDEPVRVVIPAEYAKGKEEVVYVSTEKEEEEVEVVELTTGLEKLIE
jgi:hypothetical protein